MDIFTDLPQRRLSLTACDAFDAVARRSALANRSDACAAEDRGPGEAALSGSGSATPDWVLIVAGCLVSALIGAMLGGALRI